MLLNEKETFKQLQTFTSLNDMNAALKEHKRLVSSSKHRNIYAVLDLISQHSCVYFGVSFLSQKSIAEKLNISYKTVQRSIDKLVDLGIVIKYACKRAGGDKRQTSNIVVIQPLKEDDQAEVSSHETPLLNSKNINNTSETEKAVAADRQLLIKQGLVNKLPLVLQCALAPFFDTDELYSLAGVVFKAKASIDKSIELEEHEQHYYKAIIDVMSAYKRGKVRNLAGLLSHAIKATTRTIWVKERLLSGFGL